MASVCSALTILDAARRVFEHDYLVRILKITGNLRAATAKAKVLPQ